MESLERIAQKYDLKRMRNIKRVTFVGAHAMDGPVRGCSAEIFNIQNQINQLAWRLLLPAYAFALLYCK